MREGKSEYTHRYAHVCSHIHRHVDAVELQTQEAGGGGHMSRTSVWVGRAQAGETTEQVIDLHWEEGHQAWPGHTCGPMLGQEPQQASALHTSRGTILTEV